MSMSRMARIVFSPGRMYGQLKIHKPEISYRPIVDNSVKLGGPLEKYMLGALTDILHLENVYNIKKSEDVLTILKEKYGPKVFIPKGHKLVSADFTSMYTNIPVEKALKLVQELWNKHYPNTKDNAIRVKKGKIPYISGEIAKNIISFFVKKTSLFTDGGVLYRQEKGLMMGAALSSVIAALLINATAMKIAGGIPSHTALMVYADNILMVGSLVDVGRILQTFETHLPEMPFTVEYKAEGEGVPSLQYLELGLRRTRLFRKGSKTSHIDAHYKIVRV